MAKPPNNPLDYRRRTPPAPLAPGDWPLWVALVFPVVLWLALAVPVALLFLFAWLGYDA